MSDEIERCPECLHEWRHHVGHGCHGSFPNGTNGYTPDELFYGECLCQNTKEKEYSKVQNKERLLKK
jgi:hypothetical protein